MEPERAKGATYQQVTSLCLAEIRGILQRVGIATNPNYSPEVPDKGVVLSQTQLVRQISQPLKEAQILGPKVEPTTRWEKVGAVTSEPRIRQPDRRVPTPPIVH